MKCNIGSAALLLLAVTDLSFGRTIQKRGIFDKQEVDVFDSLKKGEIHTHYSHYLANLTSILGRDTASSAADGHLESIISFRKRAEIIPPEGPVAEGGAAEGGAAEGTPSSPPAGEAGGRPGAGNQETPNTESDGGERGQSESPPPPAPGGLVEPLPGPVTPDEVLPKIVFADKPLGLNEDDTAYQDALGDAPPADLFSDEEFILWSGSVTESDLLHLKDSLKKIQSQVPVSGSTDTLNWRVPLANYKAKYPSSWKPGSIFSIRFGEAIANRGNPVHVLYSKADLEPFPRDSLLTLAELPLITGPGSRVPTIFRWDVDTFDQAIKDGTSPEYNILWSSNGDQIGTPLKDLTNDPRTIDSDNVANSAAGNAAPAPAPPPAPGPEPGPESAPASGDTPGDSSSDSGCLSCKGIAGCLCS